MDVLTELGKMFSSVLGNINIKLAIIAMLIAQALKMVFYYWQHKKINFRIFVRSSGMPSSHSAAVMALATSIGLNEGWTSASYAIAIVFSCIVMYDAAGVRQAAGKQARVLNKIVDDLFSNKGLKEDRLKEFIGHTSLEVFFGLVLGMVIAFWGNLCC